MFNRVIAQQSREQGVVLDANQDNAPPSAQLKAYQGAQWAAFCFSMIGMLFLLNDAVRYSSPSFYLATILVIIFFRGVGIIGVKGGAHGTPKPAHNADHEEPTRQSTLTADQAQDLEKMNSPEISRQKLEEFRNIMIISPPMPNKPL